MIDFRISRTWSDFLSLPRRHTILGFVDGRMMIHSEIHSEIHSRRFPTGNDYLTRGSNLWCEPPRLHFNFNWRCVHRNDRQKTVYQTDQLIVYYDRPDADVEFVHSTFITWIYYAKVETKKLKCSAIFALTYAVRHQRVNILQRWQEKLAGLARNWWYNH